MKRFLIISLFIFALLWAGETGRIVGRITDAETGEPLIGVNVIIEGTELGAATDETGTYLIFNIPPGTYTVTASYIGYQSVRKSGIQVIPDQTTTVDFKLKPTVIEVGPVEVKAKREVVVRTAVQTTRVISSKEFDRLPVQTLGGLVALQAGVVTADGFTHIRGGRFGEVATYVDGINTQDPFYGISYAAPSRDAIQEIVVLTGGFDPEYGQAMSGVVQVVTKEGGTKPTEGALRYTTDAVFPTEALNYGYKYWQGHISGPLPFIKKSGYFLSGELFTRDYLYTNRDRLPGKRDEGRLEGKLTFRTPQGKINISGFLSSEQWNFFSMYWRYWLDRYQSARMDFRRVNILFNRMIGSAVLNLKFGYFYNDRLQSVRDKVAEDSLEGIWGIMDKIGLWHRFRFKAEDFVLHNDSIPPDSAVKILYKFSKVTPEGDTMRFERYNNYTTNNPWGVPGLYYGEGDYRLWHYRGSETYTAKGDFTLNIGKIHEFKTGIEFNRYNLKLYENSLPWDPNPFWDAYNLYPYRLACYIQDRADFQGLVLRGGFRLDLLDPAAYKRVYPESLFRKDTVRASIKYRISPRFGMAFPITERIKFRFSYGHFFQDPGFTYLYESLHADIARRGNIIVGNPDLAAERTIAYETGFEAQLTDYFAFDLTLFYKDIYDLTTTELIQALPMSYYLYKNTAFGRVKGFEVTITKIKIPEHVWHSKVSYTYQEAKGTASTAYANYYLSYRGIVTPAVDYWLDYDVRHTLNWDLGFSFPKDFYIGLLKNTEIGLVTHFRTGLPYTPTDPRGNQIGDLNSARRPNVWYTDAKITKRIKIFGIGAEFFADIRNLFDVTNVLSVHGATGSPSDDGRIITENDFSPVGWIGFTYYHPARDYNHDGYITRWETYDSYMKARKPLVDNPLNYGNPRLIRIGFSILF